MAQVDAAPLDVCVIGGGITGLAAAFELRKRGVNWRLFESSGRLGGKIATEFVDTEHGRFLLERGADSFLTQKPWALDLALELGLGSELMGTNDHQRQVFVLKKGRLLPMPEGTLLMVPTRFWPFARTPILSLLGKLRAGLDLVLPRRRDSSDESLADFTRRRLGQEMLDYFAEPLLAGIYSSDPERQSMRASFERFVLLEQAQGSLIRSMLRASKRPAQTRPGIPNTVFVSFKQGMQTLPDALSQTLGPNCELEAKIERVAQTPDGMFELSFSERPSVLTRSVVFTAPPSQMLKVFGATPEALRTNSSGCLYLAYARQDIAHPLKGFGVVLPKIEGRAINAITWVSSKLEGRAPNSAVLLRVFYGGSKNPALMESLDVEAIARSELKDLLGIEAKPLFVRVHEHRNSNPQYDLGHLERIEAFRETLTPGLFVAGSALWGVGIPDCVHQGQNAARQAQEFIDQSSKTS